MRKRNVFITVFLVVAISLMVWDVYENNKKEAAVKVVQEEKHTVADIVTKADFDTVKEDLKIDKFNGSIEDYETISVNEEQQKQIINAIKNLQLQKSMNNNLMGDADYRISIPNEEFSVFVFKKEKEVLFPQEEAQTYKIINSDDFFNAVDNVIQ